MCVVCKASALESPRALLLVPRRLRRLLMPRLLLSNSPGLERRKEAVREVARASEAARSRFTALKGRMVLKPKKVHSGRHTVSHQCQYPFSFKCKRQAFFVLRSSTKKCDLACLVEQREYDGMLCHAAKETNVGRLESYKKLLTLSVAFFLVVCLLEYVIHERDSRNSDSDLFLAL